MFTGIVQSVGGLAGIELRHGGDARVHVKAGALDMSDVRLGDSIATNGVCLTVVGMPPGGYTADVSKETLSLTTLGGLKAGSTLNLEKALTLNTPLGGHLVSGHVDGVGRVLERWDDARSVRFLIEAPHELSHYIAHKGSICVDGISLTVNTVDGAIFGLNLVPHTLRETSMVDRRSGDLVNLEVDLLARYLERLMLRDQRGEAGSRGVTLELLAKQGFLRS
ncbi:MAG: riboflavin synthase [Gammaproteobacteria bacterium]|nr:riboflavin synthase [Gammaproteobacteria bacterium]